MNLTPEQIVEHRKMISTIIQHNGNVAYRMFTGNNPNAKLHIDAISAPIQVKPNAVGFTDPELMKVIPANDMDNPDGDKPKAKFISQPTPVVKAKPKKTGLKLVK